ncbi:hypothetical protein ACFQ0X_06265 [Streptomyces rectiviolaceus]
MDLTTVGTTYVNPNRVVMPIVTAPSDHLPQLQLADLVTAATTAAVAGREAGMELVELLKPLARRNTHGYIGGAGLVLWPRSLTDLFYWIFGETHYVRNSVRYPIGPGFGFSQPGSLFSTSSGLPK